MLPTVSKYIATLYETKDVIVVFGNYAIFKKSLNLPAHIGNQMDKQDLVLYIAKHGTWGTEEEMNGYKVTEVTIQGGRMLVAANETEIRFIIGV